MRVRGDHLGIIDDGGVGEPGTEVGEERGLRGTRLIRHDPQRGIGGGETEAPGAGEATASARIVVASGNSLAFRDVRVGGDLPDRLKDVVSGALDREIPLDGIPGDLRLTRLTTTSEVLSAELSGKDVTFRPDDRA
ncbi:LmeA family phospholipid-binding protein [Streptomyces sp. Tu6071]|uniref:LmeA family phospholipid-binding protein n=1 Tax=Streptomyces sp. Tu6071 TaxID=355249 RepID=UPI0018F89577|nr:LmeA family phospholipid-binding protein [Streptomyces sp. Tu6071]